MSKIGEFFSGIGNEMRDGFNQVQDGVVQVGDDLGAAGDDLVHGDFEGFGSNLGKAGKDWFTSVPGGLLKMTPLYSAADTAAKGRISNLMSKLHGFEGDIMGRMGDKFGADMTKVEEGADKVMHGDASGIAEFGMGLLGITGILTPAGLVKTTVKTGVYEGLNQGINLDPELADTLGGKLIDQYTAA